MNEKELEFLAVHCPSLHAPNGWHEVDWIYRINGPTRACKWCGILDTFIDETTIALRRPARPGGGTE